MDEFAYDAFISYCHRDVKWARWLQTRLETFHIPGGADARFAQRRRLRVFRDQTDLTGVELTAALRRELCASRYLIVICSPASAASRWVNEETAFFESLGRQDRIIAFIVSGEPDSDNPELECYPPGMRSADGRHQLGANVREIGRTKAFLKVVSLLIDVRFNRLVDREKQRRRRSILTAAASALAVGAFAAALLWRNAAISRQNEVLSFDIYGAAIVSFAQKEVIEPEDFEFIKASAEAGNDYAAFLLGDCYSKGWGVAPDEAAAFAWYKKAADDGNEVGMVALANCYYFGTGTDLDLEQAFYWNMRAAESGAADGMLNVAICYEEGRGTQRDPDAAFAWYVRSAEAGNDLGMYNLARCYRSGVGTQPDPEKAFLWMHRLAETGNAEAMYNLGIMYQHGYGTHESPEQAYGWYRKAADAGDADALYMTGWCVENRYGTIDPALEWYKRAADAGNADAAAAVERLSGDGQAGEVEGK